MLFLRDVDLQFLFCLIFVFLDIAGIVDPSLELSYVSRSMLDIMYIVQIMLGILEMSKISCRHRRHHW